MSPFDLSYGNCYHLYQPGDHQTAIFRDDREYHQFLSLFKRYLGPITDLYAYCLLPTHFHLLFRVKERQQIEYVYPQASMLGWQISTMLAVYSQTLSRNSPGKIRDQDGRGIRQIPLDKRLVCRLVVYIHQNPQLYGIVSDFRYWPYSSCFAYLRQDRRSMIAKDLLLDPVYHALILSLQENSWVGEQPGGGPGD